MIPKHPPASSHGPMVDEMIVSEINLREDSIQLNIISPPVEFTWFCRKLITTYYKLNFRQTPIHYSWVRSKSQKCVFSQWKLFSILINTSACIVCNFNDTISEKWMKMSDFKCTSVYFTTNPVYSFANFFKFIPTLHLNHHFPNKTIPNFFWARFTSGPGPRKSGLDHLFPRWLADRDAGLVRGSLGGRCGGCGAAGKPWKPCLV